MPFKTNDEFGQISKAFNDIVVQLEEYNKFDKDILLERKELAESVLRRINEPIILLDVNQNIILVSILAEELLNLSHVDIINKSASEIAQKNELLSFMFRSLIQDANIQSNTFTLSSNDIKTTYTSEMNIISKFNKNSDSIDLIGYKISLKKLSKTFD